MATYTNFEFAGEKLSDYGMIVCEFDDSGGVETVSSGADITFKQVKSSSGNKFGLVSSNYESCYTSVFKICKNPCTTNNQNEMYLSVEEVSALQRWLCRKNKYNKFKIDQDGYEHIYWNATFSSKQIEVNGRIIGLELTLYTDAPYAYMDEITIEKDCSNDLEFDIYDVSDEEGYIYPDVIITLLEDGDFALSNLLSNKTTSISNCSKGEIITIEGDSQIISSSLSAHKSLSKDFNYFFPKIINTYTETKNTFTCNLKCMITITYSPIRKVGL